MGGFSAKTGDLQSEKGDSLVLRSQPVRRGRPRTNRGRPRWERGYPREARGNPRRTRGKPRGTRGKPRTRRGDPRAMRGHPRAMRGRPQARCGRPRIKRGSPRIMRGSPRRRRGRKFSCQADCWNVLLSKFATGKEAFAAEDHRSGAFLHSWKSHAVERGASNLLTIPCPPHKLILRPPRSLR